MKIIKLFTIILIFAFCSLTQGFAADPAADFNHVKGYKIYKERFEPYYQLLIRGSEKSDQVKEGNYWHLSLKKDIKMAVKEFYKNIERNNPSLKLIKNTGSKRYYKKNDNTWYIVIFHGKWYEMQILKPVKPEENLSLKNDRNIVYSNKIKQKVPLNPVLPLIKGWHINRARYEKYNELIFSYRDKNSRMKKVQAKGKYWKVSFEMIRKNGKNNRYLIARNYVNALKELGADVLYDFKARIVAHYTSDQGSFWLKFQGFNSTAELLIIEEKGFRQTLEVDPDKLKAELDSKGVVVLKGIYFDTNKYTLKAKSEQALKAATELMKKYPSLKLLIKGHTDNQGNPDFNMTLSKNRAKAVADALIAGGVSKERLSSKGFGETVPVADNSTEQGRALNRRVELVKPDFKRVKQLITVDTVKPFPGSKKVTERKYNTRDNSVWFKKGKALIIKSTAKVVKYKFFKKDGTPDSSHSRLELIRNYENVLKELGAKIYIKDKNSLFFFFKDRGDGIKLYGKVEAYGSTYNIWFYPLKD